MKVHSHPMSLNGKNTGTGSQDAQNPKSTQKERKDELVNFRFSYQNWTHIYWC